MWACQRPFAKVEARQWTLSGIMPQIAPVAQYGNAFCREYGQFRCDGLRLNDPDAGDPQSVQTFHDEGMPLGTNHLIAEYRRAAQREEDIAAEGLDIVFTGLRSMPNCWRSLRRTREAVEMEDAIRSRRSRSPRRLSPLDASDDA